MCITTAPHIRSCCPPTAPQVDLRWTSCNPLPPKSTPQLHRKWTSKPTCIPRSYPVSVPQLHRKWTSRVPLVHRKWTSSVPLVHRKWTSSVPLVHRKRTYAGDAWHVAIITCQQAYLENNSIIPARNRAWLELYKDGGWNPTSSPEASTIGETKRGIRGLMDIHGSLIHPRYTNGCHP